MSAILNFEKQGKLQSQECFSTPAENDFPPCNLPFARGVRCE